MTTRPPRLDEFGLIAEFFAPLAQDDQAALGLLDDAAVLSMEPGRALVVTTDAMVAGVHFLPDDPPETVGAKLLRVNLSDLAAMGARPRAYTLAIMLPEQAATREWLEDFAAGLFADQRTYGLPLIGGDTVHTRGPLTMSLTALGTVSEDRALRRDGARAGHDIYVSGTIGDAALGLAVLEGRLGGPDAATVELIASYRLPNPRIALGEALLGLASAAMDVSDGLVGDLAKLCRASAVGAILSLADIPLSAAAAALVTDSQEMRLSLLDGGDDYELLFTAPRASAAQIAAIGGQLGLAITCIGRITRGSGVQVLDKLGQRVEVPDGGGYRHF